LAKPWRSLAKKRAAPGVRVLTLLLASGCAAWLGSDPAEAGNTVASQTSRTAAPTPDEPAPPLEHSSTPRPADLSLAVARGPVLDGELEALRRRAQARVLRGEAAVDSLALGHFVAIENEAALSGFHAALARLRGGSDGDGKLRILSYGASHTQSDLYTGYLRAYLQSRFGDGGQGFVLLGRVNRWYRTLDSFTDHQGLQVLHARMRSDADYEPLGLFGAALTGKYADGYAEVVTAKDSPNTRFEIQYLARPDGGDFGLQIDGKAVARVETRADAERLGVYSFQTPPGSHRIGVRLSGNGPVRLFGVIGESDAPGVVLDTLGISGSRMIDQLRWDEPIWTEAVRRRAPDLVTFAYGTNEAADPRLSVATYEAELRAVLTRMRRALPETSCVLIAPFDLASSVRPRLLKVSEVQRRVSRDFSCGFWDGYAFMGGQGSIRRWIYARPPLASPDQIHLTRRGYVYAGTALGDALMRAYDAATLQGVEPARVATSPAAP
jgi:lysophospholipase L1-like esterase